MKKRQSHVSLINSFVDHLFELSLGKIRFLSVIYICFYSSLAEAFDRIAVECHAIEDQLSAKFSTKIFLRFFFIAEQ